MMLTKNTTIDAADLRYFAIRCSKCRVKTTFDAELVGIDNKQSIPRQCSSCGHDFGELNHSLGSLVRGYNGAKYSPDAVTIEIPRLVNGE